MEAVEALIRLAPAQCLLDVRNDVGWTALHAAVLGGQWRAARQLVAAGARRGARDAAGDTPLHVACRRGDLACARALTQPPHQDEVDKLALPYRPCHDHHLDLEQRNYDGELVLFHVFAGSPNARKFSLFQGFCENCHV